MRVFNQRYSPSVVSLLQEGNIGVLKTDTLYGLVASADNVAAVERIYQVKNRDSSRACIVLIGSLEQIVNKPVIDQHRALIDKHWPGPVSLILPVGEETPEYLHRGKGSLAYRLPDDEELRYLLLETGPLLAPSANPEGQPPAMNVNQAMEYFDELIDFYVDSGECHNTAPSKLIKIEPDGSETVLR